MEYPKLFLSHTSGEPDETGVGKDQRVAEMARAVFIAAGFEVWDFATGAGSGVAFRENYEKQIMNSQAFVGVVSRDYLLSVECQNEVSCGHREAVNKRLLMLPVLIEPSPEVGLDEDARLAYSRISASDGWGDKRLPTLDEIALFARDKRERLQRTGIWVPKKDLMVERVILHGKRAGRVTVSVNPQAPQARTLRAALISRLGKPDSYDRWSLAEQEYRDVFLPIVAEESS